MDHDPKRRLPDVLARLRGEAEEKLDEHAAPGWAKPVGWIIALGIVGLVVAVALIANPL